MRTLAGASKLLKWTDHWGVGCYQGVCAGWAKTAQQRCRYKACLRVSCGADKTFCSVWVHALLQSSQWDWYCYPLSCVLLMRPGLHSCFRLAHCLLRTESAISCIQRIPSPSSPKAAPKLKYSHVVESTLRPHDPGKLSPDLSCVQSRDISTTLGSRDIQARDPGKVSHDLPRDWSSTWSQVTTWSPDRTHFRCAPSPLIGTWKTVGTINESTNQQTSHKTLERSRGAHPLPVFVPALKYGPPIWVCMPALNMYAQTTLY